MNAEHEGKDVRAPTKEEVRRAMTFYENTGGLNRPSKEHQFQHPWGGAF